MTDQHPITPPFELMNQWYKKACKDPYNGGKFIMAQVLKDICKSAAQWGADQELDACCVLMDEWGLDGEDLMQCRRPKPPNLTEQAFEALEEIDSYAIQQMSAYAIHSELKIYAETLRDALERLKKLEESTND